jgi:hypothetical protein
MTIPSLTQSHQTVTQFDLKRHVSLSNQIDALKRELSELEHTPLTSPFPVVPKSSQEATQRNSITPRDGMSPGKTW